MGLVPEGILDRVFASGTAQWKAKYLEEQAKEKAN